MDTFSTRPTHYAASPEIRSLYADECKSCGLCCVFFGKFAIDIAPSPSEQPPKHLVQIGPRRDGYRSNKRPADTYDEWCALSYSTAQYMRVVQDPNWKRHTRCIALKGTAARNVECSIYEDRAQACRDFDPGSPYCFKIRKWGGLEPVEDGYGRS